MKIKNCIICGKEFIPKVNNQECCGKECSKRMYTLSINELMKKIKEEKIVNKPKLSITDIQKLAQTEGISYGQYIAKYGL